VGLPPGSLVPVNSTATINECLDYTNNVFSNHYYKPFTHGSFPAPPLTSTSVMSCVQTGAGGGSLRTTLTFTNPAGYTISGWGSWDGYSSSSYDSPQGIHCSGIICELNIPFGVDPALDNWTVFFSPAHTSFLGHVRNFFTDIFNFVGL
jgi:hypothetical protein